MRNQTCLLAQALATLASLALASSALAAGPFDGSFSSGGLSGDYRMYTPDVLDPADPAGVLLFFHADEASHVVGADQLADFAMVNNLVLVSLQSPRDGPVRDAEDDCWWTPRAQQNAAYTQAFLDSAVISVLGDGVDTQRVFGSGLSGGADFAAELNTHLGFVLPGAAVAVCGGDLPRADGGSCNAQSDPPVLTPLPGPGDLPAGALDEIFYFFNTTPNDPFGPLAEDAFDYYDGLGFEASLDVLAGDGHCGFDAGEFEVVKDEVAQALIRVPEPEVPLLPVLGALAFLARCRRLRERAQ